MQRTIARTFWAATSGVVAGLILLAVFPITLQADTRPNFLLIMVDDLGPEWIGAYGGDNIETPHIDRLAAEGMRFDQAYSMPKCTPTRVTLLTGQYPFRHGWVNHWDVPRWGAGCHFDPTCYTTFATQLQASGYRTAIAGKWQINDFRVQPDVLAEHGFDQWCVWTGFETENPPSAERYWDAYVHTRDGSRTREGEFGPDVFVEFLIDFMSEHRDEPMLLYYPMVLTHPPFTTTPAEPEVTGRMKQHRAMVRYTDQLVGRLVEHLEALQIRERTYVIFTTDNGTSRGIQNSIAGRSVSGGKGQLTETGCHAPFIVSCPGSVEAGITSDALIDFTDLFPTLCELADVALPSEQVVDGVSFAPVLNDPSSSGGRTWALAMGGGVARRNDVGRVVPAKPYAARMIRGERYKLIVDEQQQPQAFFDLVKDPDEDQNLIGAEKLSDEATRELLRLRTIVTALPNEDAAPRYQPTPAQAWDRQR